MALADELARIAALAAGYAREGDVVSGVIATEPQPGRCIYLCSFDDADGYRSWLAVGAEGEPVGSRTELRDAVAIAALCEVAEDAAGGGDLDALLERIAELQSGDTPPGLDAAEEAARALRDVLGERPQVATPERLDAIGAAARRLEQELDPLAGSPFSAVMRSSEAAVAELQREVEAGYRIELQ